MRQQSLHPHGLEKYRKPTRKEMFLKDMDKIIPWKELFCVEQKGLLLELDFMAVR